MTKDEFMKCLTNLCFNYNKDMPAEQAVSWYEYFENDDYQDFRKAIKQHILTSRFFPTVADLKANMADNDLQQMPADQAWIETQKAISRYGYYRAKEAMESLPDAIQGTIRSLGGFQRLCESENNEWLRKDFCTIYNDMAKRDVKAYVTGDLIGIADIMAKKKLLTERGSEEIAF